MFIEEKEYSKPQFELLVINSVDIITNSPGNGILDKDNDVEGSELLNLS